MPNIDLSILNQRQTPAFFADTLANRPAAGFLGRIFVSTDTFAFYRDNGTGWDLIGGPGTGTITGSGTAGTIPLWSGASTIGNSDLRQLSSEALILNSATNDWPSSISEDPGRFLITSDTNNPAILLWSKNPFGSGNEQGSIFLGATTGLGATTIGGAVLDGFIENGTDGSGSLQIRTTNSAGLETLALKIDSTQKSTFYNDIILSSGATTKRLILDADVNVARIFSIRTNNLPRWAYRVDGTESGSNTGSDFAIRRYNDAGTFVDAPLSINRATGQSTFAKKVVIENNTSDQQLQIVSSIAPSLRIDNLQTGATNRIGIGLATTTNNFIQGTTGGEMAIFNSSTTASPILFGIYDAGLSNTQEAARISAARNFLIGTTTDGGQKLQVNGTASFSLSVGIAGGVPSGSNVLSANGSAIFTGGVTAGTNVTLGSGFNLTWGGNYGANIPTLIGLSGASGYITFYPSGSTNGEAARFSNSGNLLIGTTTDAGQKLQVSGKVLAQEYDLTPKTIANSNSTILGSTDGGYVYFQGDLANTELCGFNSGTYGWGMYTIFADIPGVGRGHGFFIFTNFSANGGFTLISGTGITWSATYNTAGAISFAFDGSLRGPYLVNNSGASGTFRIYAFGGR